MFGSRVVYTTNSVSVQQTKTENLRDVRRHGYRLEELAGNVSGPPVVAWVSKINHVEVVGAKTDENIAQTYVGQHNDGKALKAKYPFENEYGEDVDVRQSNADYRSRPVILAYIWVKPTTNCYRNEKCIFEIYNPICISEKKSSNVA